MAVILLVEDDASLGLSLRLALADQGHTVTLAPTLAAGRAATDARAFDVVLLDLGLPDGDGLDLPTRPPTSPRRSSTPSGRPSS